MATGHPGPCGDPAPEQYRWGPHVPPDLAAALDRIVAPVTELAQMVVDLQDVVDTMTPAMVELLESHGALLEFIERQPVRPNWAQDRRTLEAAQALQARLTPPNGATDAHLEA
jgi:hypothetical protein